jgi:hypothetical protein
MLKTAAAYLLMVLVIALGTVAVGLSSRRRAPGEPPKAKK